MTDDRIATEADVVTKLSQQSVPDTVARLTASHHLAADLAASLFGINALTNALVAS